MAREYPGKDHLDIVREMCQFTAAEIQCQPEVRQGFKKSVYENGVLFRAVIETRSMVGTTAESGFTESIDDFLHDVLMGNLERSK